MYVCVPMDVNVGVVQDFNVVFCAPLGLMEHIVVFAVVQFSVVRLPAVTDAGLAPKLLMIGAGTAGDVEVMLEQIDPSPVGMQAASGISITLSTKRPGLVPTYLRV